MEEFRAGPCKEFFSLSCSVLVSKGAEILCIVRESLCNLTRWSGTDPFCVAEGICVLVPFQGGVADVQMLP